MKIEKLTYLEQFFRNYWKGNDWAIYANGEKINKIIDFLDSHCNKNIEGRYMPERRTVEEMRFELLCSRKKELEEELKILRGKIELLKIDKLARGKYK